MSQFSGLINAQIKQIHKDMISAVLEDDALTVPVKFVYTGTDYTQCDNCVVDPIGGKSSNVFLHGGPIPFTNGQACPACGGNGTKMVFSEETINLMVAWNSKGWVPMTSNAVKIPEVAMQTQCISSTKPKIMRVSYIEISDVEGLGTERFERHGDPEYCGFDNAFIVTMWKKIG